MDQLRTARFWSLYDNEWRVQLILVFGFLASPLKDCILVGVALLEEIQLLVVLLGIAANALRWLLTEVVFCSSSETPIEFEVKV